MSLQLHGNRIPPDAIALAGLVLLWILFFWRLFTPVPEDQVSLQAGDFSGQFVAFGGYQYSRFTEGEIPLWNPYNNAGIPFVADTQAAVFYPPRLVTIGLSILAGEWTYNALQLEMAVHVLVYTLMMYVFVRRLTMGKTGGALAAFVAAIIAGYGGFMSGYPPLQLALLEASIWLPLALVGVLEATRQNTVRWTWLALTGLALGLSWMAGHPQTSWFATYLVLAYLAYRIYEAGYRWWTFVAGTALVGAITFGLTAAHLLPGLEYLPRTMRADLGFDAKGNGFPFQDVIQFLFPGVVSVWSPLYIGVTGIALAAIALAGRERERLFWGIAGLVALGLSFGAKSAVFHAFYNLLPGLRYFRGQERAAYLVANSFAILAALGIVTLTNRNQQDAVFTRWVRLGLAGLFGVCAITAGVIFVAWLGNGESYGHVIGPVFFSTMIAGALLLVIWQMSKYDQPIWRWILTGLIVFELFSVNMDNSNYEPIPASSQPIMSAPPLFQQVQADDERPFRVDSNFLGPYGNIGSLYQFQDIRGISPLFLDGPHAIIQRELPSEVAWELFAVRYVFSGAQTIPAEAEHIGTVRFQEQTIHLHRLTDPRPFALLVYDYEVADSDAFARALLADPEFDERETAILHEAPSLELPEDGPAPAQAVVSDFRPERITIRTDSSENALLSTALVDYPGWKATLDGEPIDIIRAYGALTAIPVPAGAHTVTLSYEPLSFRIGAILSLFTWAALGILGIALLAGRFRRDGVE